MAQTFSDAVLSEFRKAVAEAQQAIEHDLTAGMLQDFAQYKFLAGQHNGLTEAIRILDESETKLQER